MYYNYKKQRAREDICYSLATIGIAIAILFFIFFGINSCSDDIWNNGTCPNCEVRYELRGVSDGLKYYSCPNCGQEVQRY